jgi:hypothetical protein
MYIEIESQYMLSCPQIQPYTVIQFAHNLLPLDERADQLSSVLAQIVEQTRDTIPALEQEWEGT